MAVLGIKNFFNGFGLGESYVAEYLQEQDVRQDGSKIGFLWASGLQVFQVISLHQTLSPLITIAARTHPSIRILSRVALAIFSFLFIGLGGVRGGVISQKHLNPKVVCLLYFIFRHSSKIVYTAMLLSSIALIVFGHPCLGIGIGGMLFYGLTASRLPERIQFLMNSVLPFIGVFASLVGGNPYSCVMNIFSLFNDSSMINRLFSTHLDTLIRRFFSIPGVPLRKSDAPLQAHQNPNYQQIQNALFHPDQLVLNPSHYTKFPSRLSLPEERRWDQFFVLYNRVPWRDRVPMIHAKLRTDTRFLDYLAEQRCIGVDEAKRHFSEHVQALAQRKRMTPEQLLLNWTRRQMTLLIEGFSGRTRMVGKISEIQEARRNAVYLLSCLQRPQIPPRILEDVMIELAISGGGYCACSVVATTKKLIAQIHGLARIDPNLRKDYERRIKQQLLNLRQKIRQQAYERDFDGMKSFVRNIHISNSYRIGYGLGFEPLTSSEKKNVSLSELFSWWMFYAKKQNKMRLIYRQHIPECFQQAGREDLAHYLHVQIRQNRNLTELQKNELEHQLLDPGSAFWRNLDDELPFFWERGRDGINTLKGAERIFLFMLGVLRFR